MAVALRVAVRHYEFHCYENSCITVMVVPLSRTIIG